jgi:PhzF family phenazine biosynthesis protein
VKEVRFKQVDVFTTVPFRGNPVAVVLDGASLTDEQMQRIAAWTNLSETTFVLPPSSAADYRLRIFTPRAELPFAGHPTIGSAHAVLEAGLVKPKAGSFRQECGAGILDLSVDGERVWVKAPPARVSPFERARHAELEQALGCKVVSEPVAVDVGPVWLIAQVGSAEALACMPVDLQRVAGLSHTLGITGITAFGESADGEAAIHVRSFAPAHGIPEDPVCGSGNVSVGVFLMKSGQFAKFGAQYLARQGMQVGRDGRVWIRMEGERIHLGGSAVTCVEGTLSG